MTKKNDFPLFISFAAFAGMVFFNKKQIEKKIINPVLDTIDQKTNFLKFRQPLLDAEKKYSLPAGLLTRMAEIESGFRTDIISGATTSSAGAVGLMQIVPKWHPGVNAFDPLESIDYAGRYVRNLYDQLGTWVEAVAAYNWGIGNVKNYGLESMPAETRNYVQKITNTVNLPA